MINCDRVEQEILELKMKMRSCVKLEAEHMIQLLELINALNLCKCDCLTNEPSITIHSFQYEDITQTINNIDVLTSDFILNNANLESLDSLKDGMNIELTGVGRYGFIINNSGNIPFRIFNNFNIDITNIEFDTFYDEENSIFYYVSKEHAIPSSLFYKFTE